MGQKIGSIFEELEKRKIWAKYIVWKFFFKNWDILRKSKAFMIMYFQRDIYLIVSLANDWLLTIAKCMFVSNKNLRWIWRKYLKILNYTHRYIYTNNLSLHTLSLSFLFTYKVYHFCLHINSIIYSLLIYHQYFC